jgi:tRNA threonylcarbamoyladenosine biosynthesis protein TsaB
VKCLAIETATDTCSVALMLDDQCLELCEVLPRRQTERVLPMVEQLLLQAGVTLAQLDAIAFSQGPGAFTGVRVAVSVAQGLAFSADLPMLGISTLACTAQAAADKFGAGHWLVGQDARMGEVYLGGYALAPGEQVVQPVIGDMLCAPEAAPILPTISANLTHDLTHNSASDEDHLSIWRGVGSADLYIKTFRQLWPQLGEWHSSTLDAAVSAAADLHGPSHDDSQDKSHEDSEKALQARLCGPHAAAIMPLAQQAWLRGDAVAAELARPVYLRNQVIQGAIR